VFRDPADAFAFSRAAASSLYLRSRPRESPEDLVPEVRDACEGESGEGDPDPGVADVEMPQPPHVQVGQPRQAHTERDGDERPGFAAIAT